MEALQDHGLPIDDALLLKAVAARDSSAIERFYRAYSDRVMRYAYPRVQEQYEDAEEITLDTFKAAIELAHTFDGTSTASTWLCAIARLKVVDHWRRKNSGRRIPQSLLRPLDDPMVDTRSRLQASGPEAAFGRDELVDDVLACLNEDEREALMLKYVDGLSVRETAQVMRRSDKAVESLLSRAKAKSKQSLLKLNRRWVR